MWQSLLPGLRHLRAPLTAGYIWLLVLWLVFRDVINSRDQMIEIRDGISEVANWAGKPVSLAATALSAYLIGTLSISATRGVNRATGLLDGTRLQWLIPRYWIDKRTEESLEDAVERRLSEHFVDDQQFRRLLIDHLASCRAKAAAEHEQLRFYIYQLPSDWRIEQEALADEFVRRRVVSALVDTFEYVEAGKEDVGHLAYRLLGKEEQVYDEYDRLRSEGTFRLGLALPLVALCLAFAYVDNFWWLFGLPIPVVFAYLGAGSFAEAERGLAAAVSSGRVELPSLERIRTRDVMLAQYENLVSARPRPAPYAEPAGWRFKIFRV